MITDIESIKVKILVSYECKNKIINTEVNISSLECSPIWNFPADYDEYAYSVLIRNCESCGKAHRIYL